jgi:hypothetical protein
MAYWLNELQKIERCDQRQDSTTGQLKDLILIAERFGFYDAADYIKNVVENDKAKENKYFTTVNEQIKQYINDPKTSVFLYYNNEATDAEEWMYSVVVDGTDFWLDSFKTEQEALKYISDNKLKNVG